MTDFNYLKVKNKHSFSKSGVHEKDSMQQIWYLLSIEQHILDTFEYNLELHEAFDF